MSKYTQVKLGKLVSKLPNEVAQALYEIAQKMFENQILEERPRCPYCGNDSVVKNGHKCHKQEYLCKNCRKTLVSTTNTIAANSHQPREIWEEVMGDTLGGCSLDYTARRLGLYHDCTFHMRHKFLTTLAKLQSEQNISALAVYQNWMKPLCWIRIRGHHCRMRLEEVPENMVKRRKREEFQMNMFASAPEYSAEAVP